MAAVSVQPAARRVLVAEPLTAAAFRASGDVIEPGDDRPHGAGHAINGGTAWRRHDLARVEAARGGHAAISIVRAEPRPLPFRLQCLERHARGSQAFIPLAAAHWLVVVCEGRTSPRLDGLRAFVATGGQGVNYARGTWHHPLIAIEQPTQFVVVDRIADDGVEDCDVFNLDPLEFWIGVEQLR
ncbi:MAG TPA: ureidoglycolate lyase [Caldimonas sp.]